MVGMKKSVKIHYLWAALIHITLEDSSDQVFIDKYVKITKHPDCELSKISRYVS